jgi:hypothetical protein
VLQSWPVIGLMVILSVISFLWTLTQADAIEFALEMRVGYALTKMLIPAMLLLSCLPAGFALAILWGVI